MLVGVRTMMKDLKLIILTAYWRTELRNKINEFMKIIDDEK